MAKQTKKQKMLAEKLGDNQALYTFDSALKTLRDLATVKFDETVEVALNLGVDPRHADQMVRGMVSLPSGTVALEPGTTALVTVEDDASAFVAVASGHAVLVEPHGSTPLPAGSVALAPIGGPAQVDHASLVEIDADPLVALNRDLDTHL